jgi:uncharacterized membrane protein
MSSELFIYADSIFENRNIILYIISNFSYCLLKNKNYKSIYFEGDIDTINFFITVIKKINHVKWYKEISNLCSRETLIIIFETDDYNKRLEKDEKFCKIFINKLNRISYLTNDESVILFKKTNFTFDIKEITEQFMNLLTNYINCSLRQNSIYILSEELVFGENYNLLLYDKFIQKNIIEKEIQSFHLNDLDLCLDVKIREVKEYLLILFGKPYKPNEWIHFNLNKSKIE